MPNLLIAGSTFRIRVTAATMALALLASTVAGSADKPVSDAEFAAIRAQYHTCHAKPDKISAVEVKKLPPALAGQVSAEQVTLEFNGCPTETVFIVKPGNSKGELQPVVYAPHSDPWTVPPNQYAWPMLIASPASDVVASGRALVIPVWEGSFDRRSGPGAVSRPRDQPPEKWREWMQSWHQTLAVVLDYLESRPDMDAGRTGLVAYSFGSDFMAPSLLALEDRIKAAVLTSAVLFHTGEQWPGMLDNAAYLQRVRIPVLMINGRNLPNAKFEPEENPAFLLLGTPRKDKKLVLLEAGHVDLPWRKVARAMDDWLDQYLGKTR